MTYIDACLQFTGNHKGCPYDWNTYPCEPLRGEGLCYVRILLELTGARLYSRGLSCATI